MAPRNRKERRSKTPKIKKPVQLYSKENGIASEVDDDNKMPVKLICDKCGLKYKRKVCFLKHLKICKVLKTEAEGPHTQLLYTKKPIYDCRECKKKFKFLKSFKKHLEAEHSRAPGSIGCSQCTVRCPDEESLKKHVAEIHERETFQCDYCPRTFVRRAHVLRHMAQKGCGGESHKVYPCEICKATFSRRDNLRVHLRAQHILKKVHKCKICNFSSDVFPKLIVHMRTKHNETATQFECDHCGKVTSSRAAIAKHLEIHGEKKYACDVCGYATFTIEVIRRHVFTHFEEKPFKCAICGASFIQQQQLKRHLEKHAGFICATCGQTFKTKTALDIHKRTHRGLEKLHCQHENCHIAHREFPNEVSLMNHMKTHADEKQYRCELCSKRYSSEMNMKRHVLTHKLERPRRCMYCVSARAYVRGEQLVKHVRKVHADVFRQHLAHVRQVLGLSVKVERVNKSELDAILNVLDAEAERILQGYSGSNVLYGGMETVTVEAPNESVVKEEQSSPLMSETELADNLKLLLSHLVDHSTLKLFGWPEESVDDILEKVIEQCGAKPADRERWTRVQRLRENAKHLFLYVIEDKNIGRMLDTHTIDQTVNFILKKFKDEKL